MRSGTLPSARSVALVLPVLIGLGASAALLVDYVRVAPVFCAEGGGCEVVKRTALATPFGIPMPVFGLLGFALLAALLRGRGRAMRGLHAAAAAIGALVGMFLILAQLALGVICPYCMAADLSAAAAAGVAVWRLAKGWDLDEGAVPRAILSGALGVVPLVIVGLGLVARVHLPGVIADEMKRAPRGKATVVEFVDFECPFCRDEYEELAPLLQSKREQVHVVRKLVPLTRIHPHALEAARAACCGEALGKGDAMADALFRAPVEELTPEGCRKIAGDVGLDLSQYAACIADPKTDERLTIDRKDFDNAAAKGDGLPLLYIGDVKLMGAQQASELARALDRAIAKAGS